MCSFPVTAVVHGKKEAVFALIRGSKGPKEYLPWGLSQGCYAYVCMQVDVLLFK